MQNAEVSALRTLRSGYFYLFVATVALTAISELLLATIYISYCPVSIMDKIIFLVFLLLAVVAVSLYAIFWKIRPGMRQLSEVDSRFRICHTGTTLMLVGLAMLVLGLTAVAATFATSSPMGNAAVGWLILFGVIVIGATVVFIGYILTFVASAFKLYGKYRNPLYAAAGTSFVLTMFLAPASLLEMGTVLFAKMGNIITAVGYVLMYTALGGSIKKLNTQS